MGKPRRRRSGALPCPLRDLRAIRGSKGSGTAGSLSPPTEPAPRCPLLLSPRTPTLQRRPPAATVFHLNKRLIFSKTISFRLKKSLPFSNPRSGSHKSSRITSTFTSLCPRFLPSQGHLHITVPANPPDSWAPSHHCARESARFMGTFTSLRPRIRPIHGHLHITAPTNPPDFRAPVGFGHLGLAIPGARAWRSLLALGPACSHHPRASDLRHTRAPDLAEPGIPEL